MKPNLGEVTGETLASMQPRPLPQHLGQKPRLVILIVFHMILRKTNKSCLALKQDKYKSWRRECEHVCTSILFSDSWMVSCSKLWSRLSNVRLCSTRDSSLQTHPKLDSWLMKDVTRASDKSLSVFIQDMLFVPSQRFQRWCLFLNEHGQCPSVWKQN